MAFFFGVLSGAGLGLAASLYLPWFKGARPR